MKCFWHLKIISEFHSYELQGIDWKKTHVNIINFEHNFQYDDYQKIKKYLNAHDFVFDRFCGHDVFFKNKNLTWSWETQN